MIPVAALIILLVVFFFIGFTVGREVEARSQEAIDAKLRETIHAIGSEMVKTNAEKESS
ncbi:MAG: hypothetical protein JO107_16610 [Hyphomicrobiales bacterium]|nr:hypothetical protein [Hyphomicrobiales bacterium]MBV8664711.1 hypothetical protein [Hyphomicrobiales bacterium]